MEIWCYLVLGRLLGGLSNTDLGLLVAGLELSGVGSGWFSVGCSRFCAVFWGFLGVLESSSGRIVTSSRLSGGSSGLHGDLGLSL